jgi:hypothetical protein
MKSFIHKLNDCYKRGSFLRRVLWKIDEFLLDHNLCIPWRISHFIYYIKCRLKQTHMIDTKLEKGHWIDKVELMNAALLELVDSFVSKDGEDAFSSIDWNEGLDIEVKEKIIEILYWKQIRQHELRHEMEKLWDNHFVEFPMRFEPTSDGGARMIEPQDKEKNNANVKNIISKEEYFERENERILHLCVDIRNYLWT